MASGMLEQRREMPDEGVEAFFDLGHEQWGRFDPSSQKIDAQMRPAG